MDMLARREHSAKELEQKLTTRFDVDEVVQAIERLQSDGLQNDERFVESYIRSRIARGHGPLRIESDLKQRGVDREIISRCLQQADHDWYQQASELVVRKFGEEPPVDQKARAQEMRYLAARGFAPDQVFAAIKRSED